MEINDDVFKDLLGICLVDEDKLPYITTKIKVDDIPAGIYRTIYNSIVHLYNTGVDVDIVTVSNNLLGSSKLKEVGGRKVINELALEAPVSALTRSVVENALKQITFRNVVKKVEDFRNSVATADDINRCCIEYCGSISSIITGNMESDKLETISSEVDEVVTDMLTAKDKGCLGVKTGFYDLDLILGGLQKGKLYIIGARPSMGKSALAMNIAENVAKSNNVLFISLEMGKKEYAQRLMFGRAGVDINAVNEGKVSEDDIANVIAQKDYLDKLSLYIETKTPCRTSDIELAMINLQATKGSCDLVIVDYLQLLTPMGRSNRSRETDVAEMSRELKSLAVKYNVPIIVLSQLSRALESREDKRPMLSDLRESGAIEQDADVVMFVYRDEYYHPDDPAARGCADVLVRKNRGGTSQRDVKLFWQPSKVRFLNAEKDWRY